MKPVTVFFKPTCPYCQRAFALLESKGVVPTKIDISAQPEQRNVMIARANGRTTVPQIFIGDYHVGGCDDLYALESNQKLDELLK